jgi:hypothetical protein
MRRKTLPKRTIISHTLGYSNPGDSRNKIETAVKWTSWIHLGSYIYLSMYPQFLKHAGKSGVLGVSGIRARHLAGKWKTHSDGLSATTLRSGDAREAGMEDT